MKHIVMRLARILLALVWHLSSGDFTWFRFKITEIEYNQSGKATVL